MSRMTAEADGMDGGERLMARMTADDRETAG